MKMLLIYDPAHDIQAVTTALNLDGITLEKSTSTSMLAAVAQQGSVLAVLVSVQSIDDPKVSLVRSLRADGLYAGAFVLLCPGRLAEDAYRLCRDGVFDDYVFIEPLHDAFRLRLAVHRAQTMGVQERTQVELVKLSQLVTTARTVTTKVADRLGEDWKDVLPRMRKMLDLWETDMAETHASPRSTEPAALMDSVEQLRQRQSEVLASVGDHVGLIDASVTRARTPDDRMLLLIDDDQQFSELFEAIVSGLKFRINWTAQPSRAVRLIKELRPVVVFLDVDMPQLNGIEVLRAIRADAVVGKTPVILMTGKRDVETVLAAKALHVDGYLVKPPPPAEVAARLKSILGHS